MWVLEAIDLTDIKVNGTTFRSYEAFRLDSITRLLLKCSISSLYFYDAIDKDNGSFWVKRKATSF